VSDALRAEVADKLEARIASIPSNRCYSGSPIYPGRFAPDWSRSVQANRADVIPTLLSRRDLQPRLLNGSDYPLPGVVPLIDLRNLAARGLLAADLLEPLLQLRHHNLLLFDFVLKRSLSLDGRRFADTVFETAPFFAR
jgi:mannonate dehydratase